MPIAILKFKFSITFPFAGYLGSHKETAFSLPFPFCPTKIVKENLIQGKDIHREPEFSIKSNGDNESICWLDKWRCQRFLIEHCSQWLEKWCWQRSLGIWGQMALYLTGVALSSYGTWSLTMLCVLKQSYSFLSRGLLWPFMKSIVFYQIPATLGYSTQVYDTVRRMLGLELGMVWLSRISPAMTYCLCGELYNIPHITHKEKGRFDSADASMARSGSSVPSHGILWAFRRVTLFN